jgi:transposase-like protein
MITPSSSDSVSTLATSSAAKLPVTLDTQGRVRTTREQRRVILAEFERSGMSAAEFARRTGLKYSTFALWVQRCRRTKRPARKAPVRLLEAVLTTATPASVLTVLLPGGARLEVREAGQIPLAAALVHALGKSC